MIYTTQIILYNTEKGYLLGPTALYYDTKPPTPAPRTPFRVSVYTGKY